ncbi:MAG: hypothetical protein DRG50_06665, partial [Deltaproteobacteria bacterium]
MCGSLWNSPITCAAPQPPFWKGLEMSREQGDEYFQKGEQARLRCRFAEALEAYRNALSYYPKEAISERLRCHQKIGDCLRMIGDFSAAKEHFHQALSIAKQGDDELEVADSLVGLGLSMRGAADVQEAKRYLEQARGIYQDWDDPEGEAFVLWAMGGVWRIAGDLRRAKRSFKEA